MILTDRFVFLHQPKTGGTFVTSVLERLMKPPRPRTWIGRTLRKVRGRTWRDTAKHGTADEIPPSHRGLPIVATVRNPFDRYVSQYEFAWWKERLPPWVDGAEVRRRFPSYPDLSFEEFLDAANDLFPRLRGSPLPPEDAPGFQTEQFVRWFFREPASVMGRIDGDYIDGRGWERDIHPVRFLRMEDLNGELHRFLLDMGFPPEDVAFVPAEGKILPAGSKRREGTPWRSYFTERTLARVRRRERLLLSVFPGYDPAGGAP